MENSAAFHPLDYVSVVRRRLWWLVTPIVLALLVGAALVAWWPREYRAAATVGISLPNVSGQILSDAQRITNEERSRSINQLLTSEAVIERVVRAEGLDRTMPIAEAMQSVRSRVTSSSPLPDPSTPYTPREYFYVQYADSTPEATQRIANRLADVFVEESSRRREVRMEETSMFVGSQLQRSQERLAELESQLRRAKETYMGALPEQTEANVSMVTSLSQQLEATSNAIRGEQDRLTIVERNIESMRAGTTAAAAPAAGGLMPAASAAARVVHLEQQLQNARGRYEEKHPEIGRLRAELAAANDAAIAEAKRPPEERVATLRVDPVFMSLEKDREQARLRIRDLQRNEEQLRQQIGLYRSRVDAAPRVEQQLATVQREYDLERQQYTDLAKKLREAETAENLERNRGGEGFAVIARAPLPSEPASPNTRNLLMMTMLIGLCLGGGLALGREYLDRSVYDARSLNDVDLPVLGEVPRISA
jgi:polysaccharide chain length determinant protein (PEP-CTERM system associated)